MVVDLFIRSFIHSLTNNTKNFFFFSALYFAARTPLTFSTTHLFILNLFFLIPKAAAAAPPAARRFGTRSYYRGKPGGYDIGAGAAARAPSKGGGAAGWEQ